LRADAGASALHTDLVDMVTVLQKLPPVVTPRDLDQRLVMAVDAAVQASALDITRPVRERAADAGDGPTTASSNLFRVRSYLHHVRNFRRRTSGITIPVTSKVSGSQNHAWGKAHMKTQRVVALTGSLAVAIAAVVYFGLGYPPSSSDVVGTIAPAQRYQADTVNSADVQTGDQSVVKLMQTDTYTRLVNDANFRAFATNPQFIALARSPAFAALASNAQFQALAKSADFAALAKNAQFQALAKDANFRLLMAKDANFAALANNAQFQALAKDANFRQVMAMAQDANFAALAKNADFMALAKNADFMALSRDSAAFSAMAKDPQAFAALASNADFAALAQNAQFQALASNAAFSAMLTNASFQAQATALEGDRPPRH
jgi:predicted nuclease of predicted toxin-antitoxin system